MGATVTAISRTTIGSSHLVKYPISMLCEHLIKTNVLQIYIEDQQPSKASSGLASQCNNEDSKSMMLVTYATGIKSSVNLDNNTRRERKFIANSHSGKTKAMFLFGKT